MISSFIRRQIVTLYFNHARTFMRLDNNYHKDHINVAGLLNVTSAPAICYTSVSV